MKKLFSFTIRLLVGTAIFVGEILPVLAQNKPPLNPTGENILLPGTNTADSQELLQETFIPGITNTVIGFTGALSLLFVIIGGIQILTAFGNDDKIGTGKKTLTWAIGGLVVSMLSYAIVQIITSLQF